MIASPGDGCYDQLNHTRQCDLANRERHEYPTASSAALLPQPRAYMSLLQTAQVIDRQKATAYFFLLFSITYGARVVASVPSLFEQALFYSLGMVALSAGRLFNVANPVPFPELLVILADRIRIAVLSSSQLKVPAVDEFLWAFDRNYGYAEMLVGRMFVSLPMVGMFFRTLYFGEMLAIPLMYTVLPATCKRKYGTAVILLGVFLPFLYRICPGAGPIYLLGSQFPFGLPHFAGLHAREIDSTLNATPSGHFGWALLMLWFANRYAGKSMRLISAIFAVGMIVATLGTGEHYVVDLVLSVPFVASVWALVHKQWKLSVVSMIVVIAWCFCLRDGLLLSLPPLVVWILTAVTTAPFALYDGSRHRLPAVSALQVQVS